MFNKVDFVATGVGIACMALALFLVQSRGPVALIDQSSQIASVAGQTDQQNQVQNSDIEGIMEINDVKTGTGEAVVEGNTVVVHYEGRLDSGQEFDNSKKRGTPFTFTVGAGQVIAGWEQGLVGMKVGGERVLVIPSELAYGERGIGPIPGGATLTFTIELLEIQ